MGFSCINFCPLFASGKWALAKVNKLFKNPDAHQKICQVAITIIQGVSWYYKTHCLNKVITLLDSANLHDFYEILKLPYTFTHWINADHLDEYGLLNALERTLCQNWALGDSNAGVRQFVQAQLDLFISEMADEEAAYCNADEFKEALKQKLLDAIAQKKEYDASRVNLASLEVPLSGLSILDKISLTSFTFVSIGYVPLFLQEWKVIDLSYFADRLGTYKIFSLDEWVRLGLCAGFLSKFLGALHILCQNPTANQASMAKWDLITSCAEFIFNFAVFRGENDKLIVILTFIAKSLGLLSILYRPNRQPFARITP